MAEITWNDRETKRTKVKELIQEAEPYYDVEYSEGWDIDTLVAKIMEICGVEDG